MLPNWEDVGRSSNESKPVAICIIVEIFFANVSLLVLLSPQVIEHCKLCPIWLSLPYPLSYSSYDVTRK